MEINRVIQKGIKKNSDASFPRNDNRVDNSPHAAQIGKHVAGNLAMKKAKPYAKWQWIQRVTTNFLSNLNSTDEK